VDRPDRSKSIKINRVDHWPVTYRWAAMGTLLAYSALGVTRVASAAPCAEARGKDGTPLGPQALVVRRFEIASSTLGDTMDAFAKVCGISVKFADDELRTLPSKGVMGLYTSDQALKLLVADSGASYRFVAADAVSIQLAQVATSVEVSTDGAQMIASAKYSELLRDTPQTISVIDNQILEQQGVNTLRDALRNVAGISLAAGEGGAQGDNLTIRGFSGRNDIFLDGMRDFGSYYRDPFNYESVDVLQGPSSMTFGRGSSGGVVNQETKAPEVAKLLGGTLQFGSDLTRRITADVNEPIGPTGAFRLNVMGHDSQVADRDIAENRRFGVAPSLAFGLGTTTRLVLSYYHQQADDTPDYGIPWLFNGPSPVDRSNYYGFRDGNYLRTGVDIATAKGEHDFGTAVTLRNQVRYGHYKRDVLITEPRIAGTPDPSTPLEDISVARNEIAVRSLETYLGDQLDLTFRFRTGFAEHTVVTGVEGGRETSSPMRFAWSGVPGTSLLNPDQNQELSGTAAVSSDVKAMAISFGAYAIDTVKLSRQWSVIGGLRWDRFDTDYSQSVAPVSSFNRVDQKPSYRAAVVYKPKPYGSIYFDYGTSFNPSAESLSLSASNANLPPENNQTFELGTKWDFPGKRLSVEGAVFRTDKLNAREPDPNNPLLNVLAGEQRVNGAQVSVTGKITDGWQVLGSYAYLDGKLVSSQFYPQAVGAQLANVPKNTFNLWTTHALPWKLTVGGGAQFVDSRTASTTVPIDPFTGLVKQVPSYWLFNAMASRPVTEHLGVQLNLYNLANREYINEIHPAHLVPGAGFTALAGLNFKF
ncbi:MAG TPA: TonB-dependent siderophore receptor, partial [Candidatus Acidoferrum sp.]|nr:TonB-dependent siderophore receptor [Candidatus Acidoferrum sp.]